MKIVMLEGDNLGNDIDLSLFEKLGDFTLYGKTKQSQVFERLKDADIAIVNKLLMNEDSLKDLDKLKLICVTATGINNIDLEYTKTRQLPVTNVSGYSTDSVAQHTFALLFYLLEKLRHYDDYVKSGEYTNCKIFCNFDEHFWELKGKTWGILGYGAIGQKVAKLADAFGCRVILYSATGRKYDSPYEQVDWESFLSQSDVISLHAPLSPTTEGIMNQRAFSQMKKSAILLNVARGPLVNETDLVEALENNQISAAGLDVLCREPMQKENPLLKIQDSKKLFITPHIAWATTEARQRLVEQVYENIQAFLEGKEKNRVI